MKFLTSIFFILLLSSLKAQDSGPHFIIKSASIQKAYPGIPNADHTSKDHWVIVLEGPANINAKLNFLIDGYSIALSDFVVKGIVIGADADKYILDFTLTYPLDKYYAQKKKTLSNLPELEIISDKFKEKLQLDNVEILMPISHP